MLLVKIVRPENENEGQKQYFEADESDEEDCPNISKSIKSNSSGSENLNDEQSIADHEAQQERTSKLEPSNSMNHIIKKSRANGSNTSTNSNPNPDKDSNTNA
jgi:hypothetical protein